MQDLNIAMKTSLHLPQAYALVFAGYREIVDSLAAWFSEPGASIPDRRHAGKSRAAAITVTPPLGRKE